MGRLLHGCAALAVALAALLALAPGVGTVDDLALEPVPRVPEAEMPYDRLLSEFVLPQRPVVVELARPPRVDLAAFPGACANRSVHLFSPATSPPGAGATAFTFWVSRGGRSGRAASSSEECIKSERGA